MKFTKKQTILLAAALLLVVALFAGIYLMTSPATQAGSKTITVEAYWDDVHKSYVLTTDNQFLGQALAESSVVVGENSSMGLYIIEVDGRIADEAKQEWWCITKGGAQLNTGADSTPIANGDTFELTLKTGF